MVVDIIFDGHDYVLFADGLKIATRGDGADWITLEPGLGRYLRSRQRHGHLRRRFRRRRGDALQPEEDTR
jgi:hypothetical protein